MKPPCPDGHQGVRGQQSHFEEYEEVEDIPRHERPVHSCQQEKHEGDDVLPLPQVLREHDHREGHQGGKGGCDNGCGAEQVRHQHNAEGSRPVSEVGGLDTLSLYQEQGMESQSQYDQRRRYGHPSGYLGPGQGGN